MMPYFNRISFRRLVRHPLPDRINIRSVEVSCSVPSPTPDYRYTKPVEYHTVESGFKREHTVFWTILELEFIRFLLGEESIVRSEPCAILRVCPWIIRKTA